MDTVRPLLSPLVSRNYCTCWATHFLTTLYCVAAVHTVYGMQSMHSPPLQVHVHGKSWNLGTYVKCIYQNWTNHGIFEIKREAKIMGKAWNIDFFVITITMKYQSGKMMRESWKIMEFYSGKA